MAVIIIIDILLVLVLGVPVYLAWKKWGAWMSRMSDRLWPFERSRRSGLRSWAARSFVLETPTDEVVKQMDGLTEKEWPLSSPEQSGTSQNEEFNIASLGPMLGRTKVQTGIDIKWLDKHTALFQARQHAEWPSIAEDEVSLPMRQRQRLAERVLFHVEPMPGDRSRVSYELQFPAWLMFVSVVVSILLLWITWGLWALQGSEVYVRAVQGLGIEPGWMVWNTLVLWGLAAWVVTYAIRLLRLQNISLLDNLIGSFGKMSPRK